MRRGGPAALLAALCLSLASGACSPSPELVELRRPDRFEAWPEVLQSQYSALRRDVEQRRAEGASTSDQAEAFGALGMWLQANRLLEEAEPAYGNAQALAPDELRWAYYRGLVLFRLGRRDEAVTALGRARAIQPDYLPAHVHLAESALEAGSFSVAREHLKAALALAPDAARVHYLLGRVALESGDPATALEHFSRARELEPRASVVRYSLGLTYRALGQLERAGPLLAGVGSDRSEPGMPDLLSEQLLPLVFRDPGTERQLQQRGRADLLYARRQDQVAERPDDFNTHLRLAASALELGRRAEAREELERALRLRPDDAEALVVMARVLEADEPAAAEAHLRAALTSDPDRISGLTLLGGVLMRGGREGEAAPLYARAVELDPGSVAWRHDHVLALCRDGQRRAAREALREHRRDLDAPALQALDAWLLASDPDPARRDADQALALARGAFEAEPEVEIAEVVAAVLAERGDFGRARSWLAAARRVAVVTPHRDRLERLDRAEALFSERRAWSVIPLVLRPAPSARMRPPVDAWPGEGEG